MPESLSLNSLFSLAGKTALVTGASGGIGRALAIGLAAAGARVGVHGRSKAELDETRRQVEAAGGSAVMFQADVADHVACRRLIEDAHTALGRLDVLVNCAGMNRRKPIEDVTEDDYDTIMAVNLRSIYFLSQAVMPIMRDQGSGRIIHVASITSSMGLGSVSVYGMTKAALTQLTKTQAVEWAGHNIQVNCLAPGFILTPLTDKPVWGDERKRAWLLGRIPAKRPGRPEEMVAPVLLMAGPGGSYLTGQMITMDGGVLAGGSWDE